MCRFEAVLVNDRREIERLATLVEDFVAGHGLPVEEAAAVNLILDEIVVNVIAHGYDDDGEHRIHVRLSLEGSVLTIQVDDDGRPFNPLEVPPPDLDAPLEERPVGGLGLHIVKSLTSTIEYRRADGRNVLTATKTVGAASP